ncbi:MAG TPA: NAD+ synthase [Planctomycetota bacterium]|jgi:NAD+ synthase (glutamine-hydrolysing)|nr:NAD+ synthase [Planctomycetota bacterium]
MRVALAQIETAVGDFARNARAIVAALSEAKSAGARLVVFPELAVCGYPPLDLLLEPGFVEENRRVLEREILPATRGIAAAVGFVDEDRIRATPEGHPVLRNAAAILEDGALVGVAHKSLLPEYDVFFERRYFAPAAERAPLPVAGATVGFEICEDMWDDAYDCKVSRILARQGAALLANLSASPFHAGKGEARLEVARVRAREAGLPLLYVNAVGSEDGWEGMLVFDGGSFAVDRRGELFAAAARFEPEILLLDVDLETGEAPPVEPPRLRREEEVARALALGIRVYSARNGFSKTVLGLSGGIDSAVTACLAAEALGPRNVLALSLPSRFSSERGTRDAASLAQALGIELRRVPIEGPFRAVEEALGPTLEGPEGELPRENVQARLRGLVLMAVSNREGRLLLTTGNKTEVALGYCTLYGDMAGGLAPLSDVSKSEVYALGRLFNERAGRALIPESIFAAEPSPELRPDHREPFDYAIVSPLVDAIVERRASPEELVAEGYPPAVVEDCFRRIARAEYKRRQAPPGIKVTGKAFGVGRRIPIAHPFRPFRAPR